MLQGEQIKKALQIFFKTQSEPTFTPAQKKLLLQEFNEIDKD